MNSKSLADLYFTLTTEVSLYLAFIFVRLNLVNFREKMGMKILNGHFLSMIKYVIWLLKTIMCLLLLRS